MDCKGLSHLTVMEMLDISTISHWEYVDHIINKMEDKTVIITLVTSEVDIQTYLDIEYVLSRSVM